MAITSPPQPFPQLKPSLTVAGYKFLITMSNLTIETLAPATIAILNGDSRGYAQIGPLGEEALCIHLRHIVPGGTYVLFYAEYNNEKLLMEMTCSVYVNKKGLFDCNHIFHTSHRSDVLGQIDNYLNFSLRPGEARNSPQSQAIGAEYSRGNT